MTTLGLDTAAGEGLGEIGFTMFLVAVTATTFGLDTAAGEAVGVVVLVAGAASVLTAGGVTGFGFSFTGGAETAGVSFFSAPWDPEDELEEEEDELEEDDDDDSDLVLAGFFLGL